MAGASVSEEIALSPSEIFLMTLLNCPLPSPAIWSLMGSQILVPFSPHKLLLTLVCSAGGYLSVSGNSQLPFNDTSHSPD